MYKKSVNIDTIFYMKVKEKSILKGATILGIGTFLAKLLGAIYRIPLTRLIGGDGIGIYQMIFPVYTVLLEFSGIGLPNALAKIISSKRENLDIEAFNCIAVSKKLFIKLGLICSVFMCTFSFFISKLQGNTNATLSYIFLSPAIVFVSIISCYRGYFQGFSDMKPTAISQVIEQIIKVGFGLLFAKIFMPNLPLAVAGSVLAITISEFITFIFMERLYRKKLRVLSMPFTLSKNEFRSQAVKIIKTALPITLVGIMIPFSQLLDSFIIINKLSYIDNPTKLYGLFSGVAITVVNLPVSVCYGIAVASLPKISGSKNEIERKNNILYSITLTLLITVPAIFICYYFSPFIIKILFNSLTLNDKNIAIRLIKIISPTVALLSLLQTTNSILIAKGKLYFPLFSMLFGIIVKTILQIVLMGKGNINIYGGGFALIACYFVAVLINLIMIVLFRDKNENREIKVKQQNIK